MLAKVDLLAAVQPTVRACQLLQNGYPKMVSLRVVRPHSARIIKLRKRTLILAPNAAQEWKRRASQSASLPGRELDEVEAGEDLQLDSSVFEEVFPSIEKVEKPVGARVKGLPSPQSTLIPDDWKAVQDYYHRSKKQRKQERLELELEWARKRTLEERATQEEIREMEQKSLRQQDIRSAGDVVVSGVKAVDKWQERQMEDGETQVPAPYVVSGRAKPKDFRSELQFSSLEDIAQSLREVEAEPTQVEAERSSKRDSEGVSAPVSNEKTFLLTAEEKAMLRNKKLNFARISSKTWSPLHTLAASGQVYLAAELVKKGVDLDVVDSDGLTPLHRAVQGGRKTMIRMLLKAGANVQVLDKVGATFLHYSAQIGNEEVSKLLIRHGVDVNAADEDGWTALHVAVQSGRLELIKALVYRGADLFIENKDGNTALDLALAFGGCFNFYDAIKFLKKRSVFDSNDVSNSDENDQPI